MLGREQKAQLPIAAERLIAPAEENSRNSALGGGGWKWRVEADGRPWEVPGGPDRRQPRHTGPAGPLGHIPPVHGPTRLPRHLHEARFGRHGLKSAGCSEPSTPTYRCHVTNPRGPAALGRPWESPGVMSGGRGRFGRLGGALDRQFGRCHLNPPPGCGSGLKMPW